MSVTTRQSGRASGFNRIQEQFYTHLLPGISYVLVAYFSIHMLAIPPSEASAVWPAAGISIAAIFLRGYKAAYGLFIALMLFYSTSWLETGTTAEIVSSLALMVLLSGAAVLEAVGAVWLVQRYQGRMPALIDDKQITFFLLIIGPLASLISSIIAITALLIFGVISVADFFISWLTWWIGDSVGAMVVAPMLLAIFAGKDSTMFSRRLAVALPMTGVLLTIFILFFVTRNYEEQERQHAFARQAEQLHAHMEDRLNAGIEVLYSLRSFFVSSHRVAGADFASFTRHKLQRYPEIQALEWIPRITHNIRALYQKAPGVPSQILEMTSDGERVEAGLREYYYPITYIEPLKGNEQAYGFDVASHPVARDTLKRARMINGVAITAPVRLIQEQAEQKGIVAYLQVRHRAVDTGLSEEGVVAAVYRMGDFIEKVMLQRVDLAQSVALKLTDISETEVDIYDSTVTIRNGSVPIGWQADFALGGRIYRFNYSAKPDFFSSFYQWSSWIILLAGMLFTALLGGWLLSLTGRTMRVGQLVNERTASLQHEIEERRKAEKELLKVTKAVEFSPNMVLITQPDGEIEYTSPKFTEETGYRPEEVIGHNIEMLHHPRTGEISYRDLWPELSARSSWHGEIINRKKNGNLYWAQVRIAPIFDLEGILTHYVVTLLDVTENRLISEQISYHASHDQLTALVNRREFEVRLEHLLQHYREPGSQHAFCFLDLDQFKVVNDTCGHIAGDELLRQVSALLQDRVRANDTLARLGGDEFGILMQNCPLEKAQMVAEDIRDSIAQFKFAWEQQVFNIGVSIGVVEITEHSASITEVLQQADSACYTAKDSGRNRVHLYQQGDELLAQREGEMQWLTEINSALVEDRFVLFGQIIKPLQNDQLKPDVEILVRMEDRQGNLVPPGAFLPAAERYQLSSQIDLWVIDHAFAWLEENFEQFGQHLGCCAINLSGNSLGDEEIRRTIIGHLERSTMLPYKVKFEITETSAIANLTEARHFINALKAYGCQFSLDDFGSGLSSFAYLKNLPVDNLKIDGLFVKGIVGDKLDLAMVKSINDIGHVMGKTTIAEFVEDDEICDMLREIGVDYGQGYGLGRPLPIEQLLAQYTGD